LAWGRCELRQAQAQHSPPVLVCRACPTCRA
jgi:hypothetical protein